MRIHDRSLELLTLSWLTALSTWSAFVVFWLGWYGSGWGIILGYLMGVSAWHYADSNAYRNQQWSEELNSDDPERRLAA